MKTEKPTATREPRSKAGTKNRILGFRARPDLEALLVADAKANNRSVSEEIETKLRQAYSEEGVVDRFIKAQYGRRANYLLVSIFSNVLVQLDERFGGDWWDTVQGRAAALIAFDDLTKKWIAPPDDAAFTQAEWEEIEATVKTSLRVAERAALNFPRPIGDTDYAAVLDAIASGETTVATDEAPGGQAERVEKPATSPVERSPSAVGSKPRALDV